MFAEESEVIQMNNEVRKQVMREAVEAGERALLSLRAAQDQLNRAKNWGLLDLFGGGLITDFLKHSRLDDAVSCMNQAKKDLQIFQRELNDIDVPMDLQVEVDGFLKFADFFFDGIIADYFVQSKISKAKTEVEDAIYRVESLLLDLKERSQ